MSDRAKAPEEGRRDFLKGVVLLGGAATAAAVTKGVVTEAEASADAPQAAPRPAGYRLTPHIAKYYEKAGF